MRIIDWKEVEDIRAMLATLSADIKPKQIWSVMHDEIKEEITAKVKVLIESRSFAAPAEWDGTLKEPLLLVKSNKLPNGFRIFLKL